jgi:putative transposase
LNVSSSTYFAWLKGFIRPRHQEDKLLAETLLKEFEESRQTYGVPRLQQVLRNAGKYHGKARIKRLMQQEGLKPKAARRFKITTDSCHSKPIAENLLKRQFNPKAANTAWASDITYIHTNDGWLYLATVIDLFNRKIVGWSMGVRLVTGLIEKALIMAIQRNKPPKGIIPHSDRGSQYCSNAYQSLLKKLGLFAR